MLDAGRCASDKIRVQCVCWHLSLKFPSWIWTSWLSLDGGIV